MHPDRQQVAVFDDRPFFERALALGVRSGILSEEKVASIAEDGAKGMVQIAEYFGTQYLRPNIDEARERIVNLVSLFLEESSGGDLEKAARSLRDGTFLSHSRGGSEMLKSLWAMPEDASFGIMVKQSQKAFLADWSLRSISEYRQTLEQRRGHQLTIDAALWCADQLGVAHADIATVATESIIRSAVLAHLHSDTAMSLPNATEFVGMLATIRKNGIPAKSRKRLAEVFKTMPEAYQAVARKELKKIEKRDLPRLLDSSVTMDKLVAELEPLYFLRDFGPEEANQYDAAVSEDWQEITGGKVDDNSLLTIFLCLGAAAPPRTALTKSSVQTLISKVRKNGLQRQPALAFIRAFAPYAMQDDLESLWNELFPELENALLDPSDNTTSKALAFLTENCNIR